MGFAENSQMKQLSFFPACGGHWEIGGDIKAEAVKLCERLNAEDKLKGRPARMIDLPDGVDKAP